MARVCFNHVYGRPCEYHNNGGCNYSHDDQLIPFGYYKQADQPEPKGKRKVTRNRLMAMRVEDFVSLMDKMSEEVEGLEDREHTEEGSTPPQPDTEPEAEAEADYSE